MSNRPVLCQPISLPIDHVRQKNICGCGLAALEMVLRYYGATDTQTDFLENKRIRRLVQNSRRGLSEGTLGTLALRRGFRVVVYGRKPRLTKTFFKLGGRVKRIKTDRHLIFNCLQRGIPPIILIPKVCDAYERKREELGHYVVINRIDHGYRICAVDPQYSHGPDQDYWASWSSSLIEIKPLSRRKEP